MRNFIVVEIGWICYNMDKKNRKNYELQFYNFWLSMEVTENEELSFGLGDSCNRGTTL